MERKWQIKRKSNIGQQLETVLDNESQKWIKETAYGEPNFELPIEEARQKLANLKAITRMPVPIKWIRLYEIGG
jgi:hypothetical protein